MSHKRHTIRDGAGTRAGGKVRDAGGFAGMDGVALACEGDTVDDPACRAQAVAQRTMPRLADQSSASRILTDAHPA